MTDPSPLTLSPADQRQILVDEVHALNKILADSGWEQTGRVQQPRPHWALTARRAALDAIRKLDAKMPAEADDDALETFMAAGRIEGKLDAALARGQ